jgi:hypothetical protein
MDAASIESFLMSSKDFKNFTILGRTEISVILSMEGVINGSYGMKTYTHF